MKHQMGACFYALHTHENSIEWTIEGTPSVSVKTPDFPGGYITAVNTVNRIPDVLNAPAGLLTVSDLPQAHYLSKFATAYLD